MVLASRGVNFDFRDISGHLRTLGPFSEGMTVGAIEISDFLFISFRESGEMGTAININRVFVLLDKASVTERVGGVKGKMSLRIGWRGRAMQPGLPGSGPDCGEGLWLSPE